MKDTIRQLIQQALTQLVTEGVLPEGLTPAIQVENARDKTHGDFASNIAMMLAKPAGMKPRDLAEKLIATLPASSDISKVEIAGPGFLNFFQNTDALAQRLDAALADEHLGVRKAGPAEKVVIDMSAPNLAKEMHVGHLRSTIIGDSVARVLEFLGDDVIRQNHVGDWGAVRHATGVPGRKPDHQRRAVGPGKLLPRGEEALRRVRGLCHPRPWPGGQAASRRP